tara:strand:+ start:145 stop:1461 length:1317 start_codon:yes stop_codon:yes gene_type:complete
MAAEGTSYFNSLLTFLESAIGTFPDLRTRDNTSYKIRDAALSAFSVFYTQSPSFLEYQRTMQRLNGSNNARNIFGAHKIPCDNQIRSLLDPVTPETVFPVFHSSFDLLEHSGVLQQYRSFNNDLLLLLDATHFHSSTKISCESCSKKERTDGTIEYTHSAITPVIAVPGNDKVISLPPEFIRPQDGTQKEDCENAAAKRWLEKMAANYARLGVTILGDDLYCNQPICTDILDRELNFILVCKPSSHKWLTEWIAAADAVDLHEIEVTKWTGKEHRSYTYRFMNKVPIRDSKDALLVNWVELVITNEKGKVIYKNSFATNHEITAENVEQIVEAGRCRWKIENENNNTLKTKGYHLEHNFGHGMENLSNLLLTLNLLAFLFHTVLEYFDSRYRLIRKTLSRRKTFFHDIQALMRYVCFDSWQHMMVFMIRGLELPDPGG